MRLSLWQTLFVEAEEASRLLFFMAGTSDARALAVALKDKGYSLLASVVTEHAAKVLEDSGISARHGRLGVEQMCALLEQSGARVVIDASHPFAEEAHKTAMSAAQRQGISYIRFERVREDFVDRDGIICVESYEQAAEIAAQRKGSVMLTTGSKTLHIFANRLQGDTAVRLVARMLPLAENMEKCALHGVEQRNIIAMQGPFSYELNQALYRHYETTLMITKESGGPGAVDQKVEAARDMGIDVVMIGRPQLAYGTCYSTVSDVLEELSRQGDGHGL